MLTGVRARLRTVRCGADAGVTLVELLVGMALSTIIAAMTLALFVNVNDSTQGSTDRAIVGAQARTVLQSWTSYLHVADGPTYGNPSHRFEWITSTEMLFYADLGNRASSSADAVTAPTTVWLRLTGGRLIEELFNYGSTTPKACRILADHVTSSALFTASDLTYTPMPTEQLGAPLAVGGPGCTELPPSVSQTDLGAVARLQQVARIEIDFSVTDTRGKRTLPFRATADVPTLLGGSP